MKEEKLFETMADIDDSFISEAHDKTKRKPIRIKWAAAAACLCLVAAGAIIARDHFGSIGAAYDPQNIAGAPSTDHTRTVAENGLYIPALELPKATDTVEMDMIGFVVYKGGIYTQAECCFGDDALMIDSLLGDYLGYATGSIDEWSAQEEYAKEFASSLYGDVYAVKGYDTGFRICIRNEYEDENGEKQLFIEFLDRLNGISLSSGADLFESRLQLRDRIARIQCQSHNDWDNGLGNLQNAELDAALWEEFLNQIDSSPFIYTWDPENPNDSIYLTDKQAHLILTMDDGTVVRLSLIEGGYVGYDAMGWYFVQIPGEVFEAVFTACGG